MQVIAAAAIARASSDRWSEWGSRCSISGASSSCQRAWNYPVNLSLMPVVTAIAAGNRVMLKPSKFAPRTNAVLAEMVSELFPAEQVTVVSGDGAAFSSLPFDHLVFTGSTAVGKAVMKAASEHLVPVTLELGGKSPSIVAKGQVNDRAVSNIVFGKLLSGGQTCIAPDHALVHEAAAGHAPSSASRLGCR